MIVERCTDFAQRYLARRCCKTVVGIDVEVQEYSDALKWRVDTLLEDTIPLAAEAIWNVAVLSFERWTIDKDPTVKLGTRVFAEVVLNQILA